MRVWGFVELMHCKGVVKEGFKVVRNARIGSLRALESFVTSKYEW